MRFVFAIMIVVSVVCATASASPISIANASFEFPSLSSGAVKGQVGNTTGTWIAYTPGWADSLGADVGYYFPTASVLLTGATNGSDILWVNTGFVYQTLSSGLQNNTTYTLQVDVAQRADQFPPVYFIYLVAGGPSGTILVADNDTLHPALGTWLTSTLTYNSGANNPLAGDPLTIELGIHYTGDFKQADFDNVRLNATPTPPPIPEPSSLILMASAATILVKRALRDL